MFAAFAVEVFDHRLGVVEVRDDGDRLPVEIDAVVEQFAVFGECSFERFYVELLQCRTPFDEPYVICIHRSIRLLGTSNIPSTSAY